VLVRVVATGVGGSWVGVAVLDKKRILGHNRLAHRYVESCTGGTWQSC